MLTNARAFSTFSAHIASLKYISIYEKHALPDFFQSWKTFCQGLAAEGPYQANIEGIRLRLVKLQVEDSQVHKIEAEKLGRNWQDFNKILYHQGLSYISEIIKTELISRYYNDLLVGHFGIEKIQELVTRKYY